MCAWWNCFAGLLSWLLAISGCYGNMIRLLHTGHWCNATALLQSSQGWYINNMTLFKEGERGFIILYFRVKIFLNSILPHFRPCFVDKGFCQDTPLYIVSCDIFPSLPVSPLSHDLCMIPNCQADTILALADQGSMPPTEWQVDVKISGARCKNIWSCVEMGCSLLTEMSARDQDDYQDQVHHTNDQTQRMTCSHLGAFILKLLVTFPRLYI